MGELKKLLRRIVPKVLLSWYHFSWAVLGAALYGFPARKMTVIGITGTDGKSTTVEMVTRILKEAGHKTCSTSSVWFQVGDKKEKNHLKMGMPGRMFLYKFLRKALKEGCTHAVVEVSSEGILQHRHRFLNFHIAVLTNLSPEHIEHHGSFEKYREEKQKLFRLTKKVHVINGDEKQAEHFLQYPAEKKYLYHIKQDKSIALRSMRLLSDTDKTIKGYDIQEYRDGISFVAENTKFHLRLIGQFNAYNALAAICVGLSLGVSLKVCSEALEKMERMPGRTDPVLTDPFVALVDYAVTPKAFENLYKGVQRLFQPRRLICVFGACGGGRDKWKRPILGKIAAAYCNEIILTNEDPYDENPEEIVEQIAQGIQGNAQKILDRREAIRKALSMAQEGDVVVISGKGSEDAIAVAGGKKIPWDERTVVLEEFAKLPSSQKGRIVL